MTKVIIIGSGPAAAFCAVNLKDVSEVVVIEKGDEHGNLKNLSGNLNCKIGTDNSLKIAEQIGGASNYWGGGFIKYDEVDVYDNDRANFNSWPIAYDELSEYYKEVFKICDVFDKKGNSIALNSLKLQKMIQQTFPYRVQPLFDVPNVKVLTKKEVIRIKINSKLEAEGVILKDCATGKLSLLSADFYVIAAGTINNLRIVYNTFQHGKMEIPEHLGQNLGSHPKVNIGVVKISGKKFSSKFFHDEEYHRVWYQYGILDKELIGLELPNHSIRFEPIVASKLNALRVKIAEYLIVKKYLKSSSIWFAKLRDFSNAIIRFIDKFIFSERYRIRLYLDQPMDTGINCSMSLNHEDHLPNFSIQVSETALQRLKIKEFCHLFAEKFRSETNISLPFEFENITKSTVIHSHFTGGCIMGKDATNSIVNANCELHNIETVFLAGPSVFPTHSFCNPFLTISAMSLRLGRYINDRLQ